jgi:hypothetical protein
MFRHHHAILRELVISLRMMSKHVQRLVGRSEGKRQLGRPRRKWEDNIKMVLQEVECRGMDWIELVQDKDS